MKKLLRFHHVNRRRQFAEDHLGIDKPCHGRGFAIDLTVDAIKVANLVWIKVYAYRDATAPARDDRIDVSIVAKCAWVIQVLVDDNRLFF